MKKVIIGVNDLASQKPEVAKEFLVSKNNKQPFEVRFNDRVVKYWWKCSKCGFEWQATPLGRSVLYCKSCRAKDIVAKKNKYKIENGYGLVSSGKYQNLISEFDVEFNKLKGIDINDLTEKSNARVRWICSNCGWRWIASVSHRTEGCGCPSCSMKVVNSGFNDLKTRYPELAEEWDSDANGIDSSEIIAGGNDSHKWVCKYCGNKWSASISNRIKGTNCPKCKGYGTSFIEQAIFYYVSLRFPEALNRYIEPTTNVEIDIYIPNVRIGIEYDGHRYHKNKDSDLKKSKLISDLEIKLIRIREYKVSLDSIDLYTDLNSIVIYYKYSNVYSKIDDLICEILSLLNVGNIKVNTEADRFKIRHLQYNGMVNRSLAITNSKMSEMWDYDKNYPLTPYEVTSSTNLSVNWKCPKCGFLWSRKIVNQVKSLGCPKCNDRIVHNEYNFARLYPELAKEWDYTKNKIKPSDIKPSTHKKFFWICMNGHPSYLASPANRINGTGCSVCGRIKSDNKRKKAVIQIDKINGMIIDEFCSAREAWYKTGVNYKKISACCNGKNKTAGGYRWKFKL